MIEVQEIGISFGSQEVVRDLSFSVKKGEKVAIVGESGKGKSTILNALAGFTPVSKGQILFNGKTLSSENMLDIRSNLSWVPQETALQFSTVREIIETPFDFDSNQSEKPSDDRILEVFDSLSLGKEILSKTPSTISGGQRQRVLLATSILLAKPILITDEPTSALDENNRKKVTDLILSQNQTIIASTHDAYWMDQSDKVIRL